MPWWAWLMSGWALCLVQLVIALFFGVTLRRRGD